MPSQPERLSQGDKITLGQNVDNDRGGVAKKSSTELDTVNIFSLVQSDIKSSPISPWPSRSAELLGQGDIAFVPIKHRSV